MEDGIRITDGGRGREGEDKDDGDDDEKYLVGE